MVIYSIILFAVAALLIVFGILIYRGKTGLIHSYHQAHVTDKAGYAKAFGKALFVFSLPLLVAGVVGLFFTNFIPTLVLLLGLCLAFISFVQVQRRYNGGLF